MSEVKRGATRRERTCGSLDGFRKFVKETWLRRVRLQRLACLHNQRNIEGKTVILCAEAQDLTAYPKQVLRKRAITISPLENKDNGWTVGKVLINSIISTLFTFSPLYAKVKPSFP